jgi:DNA repair exonuclease SbcCD nuclease subunit
MKIMLVSDLQQNRWKSYPECNEEGINLRLLDTEKELGRLQKIAVKNKVEALFVLGDIFEARNELHISVLNSIFRALCHFSYNGIRVVLLVGNHDRAGIGTEHALEVFSTFCDVIDKPTRLEAPLNFVTAIPFLPEKALTEKAIAEFTDADTRLIIAHTSVDVERGLPAQFTQGGIPLSAIPRHMKFVSGHYHKFTELIKNQAYFLGSMLHVDQSDVDIEKFYGVYDSEKDVLRFFPTKGPRFVHIDLPDIQDATLERLEPVIRGNFVTVNSIPQTPSMTLADVEGVLRSYGVRAVQFAFFSPLQGPPLSFASKAEGLNHAEVVREYVEQSHTPLDKEALIDIGTEVVDDVQRGDIVEVN